MTRKHFSTICVVALFLVGAGLDMANGGTVTGSFAGRISGSNAFVSIVAHTNGSVTAYVCDGAKLSAWFEGSVSGSSIDLKSPTGGRIVAELSTASAKGTFTPSGGSALNFTSTAVTGGAGLYHAEQTVNGVAYQGGWILLPDGDQRGTLSAGGKLQTAPKITATTKTVNLDGGGTLGIVHTEPWAAK